MIKTFRLILSSVLLTFLLSINSLVFASPTTVNLITTNDMHGVLEESDTCIGISQASAIKNSTENALLIDSGDATQGTTLATINKGADIIKLMNAAGYDCMVAGNHEFDYGSEQILANAEAAHFPILSANSNTATGTLLPGTSILTQAGKKIGFVGITTSITNTATNPALRPGVTFGNEITAAKNAIASLQGQVDTIVLLTHLGNDATAVPVTSEQLLDGLNSSELSQVSAVLDGHSHTIESEPYVREGYTIPIIQDQTQLSHIGKVAITFNDDGSVSATEEVMDYDTANQYPITSAGEQAKEATKSAFASVKADQEKITSQLLGKTDMPLWGGYIYWDYAEPRIVETSFGDLVTDAYVDAAKEYADSQGLTSEIVGVTNGGGIGNSIDPGDITFGGILNAFNHGNMMVVLQTTPSELYSVLEKGLVVTGQDSDGMLTRERVSGSFIQCSGFSYSYDPSGAEGSKVTSVVTDKGTQLSRTDTQTPIIVATQNYVQTSFSNSQQLTMLGGEDTVISNYVLKQAESGALNYPVNGNRITISNDISPEEYSVSIPVYDVNDTENQTPLPFTSIHLSIDGENSQVVQTGQDGNLNVTLSKGPHTLEVEEAQKPVYVNNYSGSGTNFTRAGYYSLSFSITPGAFVPATDLTLSTDSVDLATRYGSNTQTVTATPVPANTTEDIIWSVIDDSVVSITPNGNSAVLTAVSEGRAEVTVSCGLISKSIDVIVSNDPIVATDYYVSDMTPDSFTVEVLDVHANKAISSGVSIEQVAFFTWSDAIQNDMDCLVVEPQPGTNNYVYTFPINDNESNRFYINACDIKINIYASSQKGSNGNMIGALFYAYNNTETMPTNLGVTTYCQNIGFVKPTVGNNIKAGSPNFEMPIEGIRVASSIPGIEVYYSVHVRNIGWLNSVSSGTYAGTMHQNLSIEAVKMFIGGPESQNYQLTYQTTGMDGSVSGWCTNAEVAGSTGKGLPLKAIQINIVPVTNN